MSDDAPTLGARRQSWRRLAALLVLIALVSLVIAWVVQPKRVAVTALFQVDNLTPSLLGNQAAQPHGEGDFEILKNTQIALLKSELVLRSALRNPAIAGLSVFPSGTDPVEWLQDHLEVSFPQHSEILEIKVRGTKSQAPDLVQIVDAIAAAYNKEVIGNAKARQLNRRDMLERSLQNLNGEIKRKYEDYLDIAKGMGSPEGSRDIQQQLDMKRLDRIDEELAQLEREQLKIETGGDAKDSKFVKQRIEQLHKRQAELEKTMVAHSEESVDLTTRKNDLDQLQGIANELSVKLEKLDIDSEAPYRIRQLQPATIEPGQIAVGDLQAR